MSPNALSSLSYFLLGTISLYRSLPILIFSRPSSCLLYGFGATTLLCGLGLGFYHTYRDIYLLWREHQLDAAIDELERAKAQFAYIRRHIENVKEARRREAIDVLEGRDEKWNEMERMVLFWELPVACAETDDEDPEFEERNRVREMRRAAKFEAMPVSI